MRGICPRFWHFRCRIKRGCVHSISYRLEGACTPSGGTLSVSVGGVNPGPLPSCNSGRWSGDFSLSSVQDSSSVAIGASYTQGENTVVYPGATVIKDTVIPSITLSPLEEEITRFNHRAYTIEGTCDDVALTVDIRATVTADTVTDTATCIPNLNGAGKIWSKSINVETLGAGTVTIEVSQTDIAGNKGTNSKSVERIRFSDDHSCK